MEDVIKTFEHKQFGKIRIVMINDEPWLVASDVCKILELKNPSDILKRLDKTEKGKIPESRVVVDPILNIGSAEREVNIVNEPGFYHLVFSSRKKEACAFQYWVYHKVLPSIRKTGSYSIAAPAISAPAKKKALKNPRRRAGQLKDSHVYVVLLSNNTVKIGNASDVDERIKQIERKTNLKVLNHHYSPLMTRKNACLMEIYCQKIFSPYKTDGEFFSVNFEATCNVIDIIAKLFDTVSNFERAEKLLAIAGKFETLSENQVVEKALLLQATNIIVDSKID